MRKFAFVKTTVIGGVFYLVPLIVLVAIAGKAVDLARVVVTPLGRRSFLGVHFGVGMGRLGAWLWILLFCFLAGLFSKTAVAQRIERWLEDTLLSKLPGYSFMKSMGASIVGFQSNQSQEVVLARIEDSWQIGFLVERVDEVHRAVYVPGSPSPWSGSLYFMTEDRIRRVPLTVVEALSIVKRVGLGSKVLFKEPIPRFPD